MSISVVLYYLLLGHCLSVCYYLVPSYTFGTLLHSTVPMHPSMVLYYLLLAHCLSPMVQYYLLLVNYLSLYGTLLPSTCSLLIHLLSTIFYWLTAYTYDSLLTYPGSMTIPLILSYLIMAPCLYLYYSITFYWPTASTYGTQLSSTGSLPIPMIVYYLILSP